ncbi:RIP metalloprotease RseP [Ostreiculturibacter nitratireducens]|uniref:RIP metalloprotease RseP n=1 Tax=Ostreiculturibacter nitratireducens TaxID=3075226 RepID=UPI003CCC599F
MDPTGLFPSFGNFFVNAAAFAVALSVIVAVHEFGHYIVGRWSGIHAEVFSIGFGPKLFSRVDKRGTRWQLAAIPLGGYVRFLGDADVASGSPDEETLSHLSPKEKRHTLHGAPLWARAATVAAGPIFNFVLSILIFAAVMLVSGVATEVPTVSQVKPLPSGSGEIREGDQIVAADGIATPDYTALFEAIGELPSAPEMTYVVLRDGQELSVTGPALYPPRVEGIAPGTAASDAGLQRGDVVIAADGVPVNVFADLQAMVKEAEGRPIQLTVWREGEGEFEAALAARRTDIPRAEGGFETRWLIGVTGSFFFEPAVRRPSPWEATTGAVSQTWDVAATSLSGLWHMITGAISSCNLRGPIGIAESSGAAASQGPADFIWFVAFLSTAIGLLNLFPIPVLDGGHLVFHAWEWSTGKPPSEGVLRFLMAVGLALVLALMTLGLANDLFCP